MGRIKAFKYSKIFFKKPELLIFFFFLELSNVEF